MIEIWNLWPSPTATSFTFLDKNEKELFFEALMLFNSLDPVLPNWKSFRMRCGEPKIMPNIFELFDNIWAICSKSLEVFKSHVVTKHIEFLPFETNRGVYHAIHHLNFLDCLDRTNSEYTITPFGQITEHGNLRFLSNRLSDSTGIFKIPELPYANFVTSHIQELCTQFNLSGIEFDFEHNLVWSEIT